ncbi:hypothetical protein CEXT_454771 [Caerostris extrusa]|uniref:Uncharacterized protein n=1 Tax=Caerostris extrusa TaxID=172846 RepID=A0AAV4Y620_CAEEX|nr:hypothetical protein CEXT_454771 [Caerostris extrusa]
MQSARNRRNDQLSQSEMAPRKSTKSFTKEDILKIPAEPLKCQKKGKDSVIGEYWVPITKTLPSPPMCKTVAIATGYARGDPFRVGESNNSLAPYILS